MSISHASQLVTNSVAKNNLRYTTTLWQSPAAVGINKFNKQPLLKIRGWRSVKTGD